MNRVYEKMKPLDDRDLKCAIEYARKQTESCLPRFIERFKYSHSTDGFYPESDNVEWTTGFWTGELWLMYELTSDDRFKSAALVQVDSFLDRIEKRIDVNHHDMGFLYSPSCVAAYKLTGSEAGKKAALLASDNLISRFQEKGQFIQAWGDIGDKDNYRLIIDCLLNVPLLFWASETSGKDIYREIAEKHINTAMEYVLRQDHSTYHTYFFDPESGKPLRGVTHQGYRDGSSWARGQAWGIYGAALAYRYTGKKKHLDVFWDVLGFFLDHLPEDVVPYWDFDFKYPSTEPKDSSALAIAICGMLEAARFVPNDDSDKLIKDARILTRVLFNEDAVKNPAISNGQLLHGTYARKSPYNPCNNRGVDECNLWGDYFYIEALRRLTSEWSPYW